MKLKPGNPPAGWPKHGERFNFVSNAIRYGSGGRVLIGARRNGKRLALEVHNTGPGMPEQELAAVKQRHARGRSAGACDAGKGVGLSIVSTLAHDYNLEWTLVSREKYGTIAKLLVPIADD